MPILLLRKKGKEESLSNPDRGERDAEGSACLDFARGGGRRRRLGSHILEKGEGSRESLAFLGSGEGKQNLVFIRKGKEVGRGTYIASLMRWEKKGGEDKFLFEEGGETGREDVAFLMRKRKRNMLIAILWAEKREVSITLRQENKNERRKGK